MSVLLWTVLTTSLLGSLHCAGMCGPLVAFYSGSTGVGGATGNSGANGRRAGMWAHMAYNGGRLLSYTALGVTAGAVGSAVDLVGRAAQVSQTAALLGGGFIVILGTISLLRAVGVRLPARLGGGAATPSKRLVTLRRKPPIVRAGILGVLTGALPCGWLYAFVLAAAATGSAITGGLLMATFWLGTVPIMLGLGVFARRIARVLGRRLPVVTAALLITMGVAALLQRVPMVGGQNRHPTSHEPTCHGGG